MPYQVFEVKAPAGAPEGGRDHLILAVGNDSQYAKFCTVAGRPDLAENPLYAQNQGRVRHRATLVPLLEALMLTRTKAEWLPALESAKVPCGAINNLAEVFADPHVQQRGMVTHWQHPDRQDLPLVASPLKLSRTPVRTDLPPPLLGQHTDEVLQELLGYSTEQVAGLKHDKTI